MNAELDTAAIRAAWSESQCGEAGCAADGCEIAVIHRLCDAVDELRTELDKHKFCEDVRRMAVAALIERDAAEAALPHSGAGTVSTA